VLNTFTGATVHMNLGSSIC